MISKKYHKFPHFPLAFPKKDFFCAFNIIIEIKSVVLIFNLKSKLYSLDVNIC